jgi:hypothetical protein
LLVDFDAAVEEEDMAANRLNPALLAEVGAPTKAKQSQLPLCS